MRREDRQRDEAFGRAVLDRAEYGVLSVTDAQGAPYAVPLSIVRVDDAIYFHSAQQGKKTDALRAHPEVCLVAVGRTHVEEKKFTTKYESCMVRGRVSEVTDRAQKIRALRALCAKYTPNHSEKEFDEAMQRSLAVTAIWRMEIAELTAKRKGYIE